MRTHRARAILASLAAIGLTHAASAQTPCGQSGVDLIIGDIPQAFGTFETADTGAFRLGVAFCNIGSQSAQWQANTPAHPIYTGNLFRLVTLPNSEGGGTRLEQIGQGWARHEFFPLSQALCCTCTPAGGSLLGAGCSTVSSPPQGAPEASRLGPKWQVNPWTGVFAYPTANPPIVDGASRFIRVFYTGFESATAFFLEAQTITPDEPAANRNNNASYRPVTLIPGDFTIFMTFTGPTVRERPGIAAWSAADPAVKLAFVDVPGDGRLFVASRATQVAAALWRYDYAVQNLNADRAVRSVEVPLACPSAPATAAYFRDVPYADGDGLPAEPGGTPRNFSGDDWAFSATAALAQWQTLTFAADPNANALRWGTMYNFSLHTAAPPAMGSVTLGLFKPGAVDSVSVAGLDVPAACNACLADFNHSGSVGVQDVFDFLAAYFSNDPAADVNHSGTVTLQDVFDFLGAFFTGC